MLSNCDPIVFVSTAQADKALAFYRDTLGLRLVEDSPFALVFDLNGTMLRVSKVQQVVPVPYTVMGWHVDDIEAELNELAARGVKFERYPGLPQDDAGIWTTPDGARIAWFMDPDGNALSLSQSPKRT